jgi:large subunit ribosomal protein L6
MSRVGKNPVVVPSGVTVTVDGQNVTAKGKLGELSYVASNEVELKLEENNIIVTPRDKSKRARTFWGTDRAQINSLVNGVADGFTRKLEITGVGYRAQVKGSNLMLSLGFSHDVEFPIPQGLKIACPSNTEIEISGADKQLVGQTAAEIRAYRPPEPYKGKGVRYAGEWILRKEGKKK